MEQTIGTESLNFTRFEYNGIPIFRTTSGRDTAKSATFVAKILEVANRGISDTTFRRSETPLYREDTLFRQTNAIVDAYRQWAPTLSPETIVFGPAHRLGVYLARIFHAPFLPMQFLTFFEEWEDLKYGVPECTAIAGCDNRADPLHYLWIKPHTIPDAYTRMLRQSKNIVVYRGTNYETQAGKYHELFLHRSAHGKVHEDHNFHAPKPNHVVEIENLIDWEFGLPDETIAGIKRYAAAHGKRLVVIEGDADHLKRIITPLVLDFYAKNNVHPVKMSFNSYSIAHPYYEIESLTVPLCFFRLLDTEDSQYTKKNKAFITHIQQQTGITRADLCLNTFGGDNLKVLEKYLIHDYYFTHDVYAKGSDEWDRENKAVIEQGLPASRLRTERLRELQPRKWNFFTLDDLVTSLGKAVSDTKIHERHYPSLCFEYKI